VLVRSAVPSFTARQDTMAPLWASLSAILVNVALKLVLTGPYGVTGLALATAISQWVNLAILVGLAWRRGWTAPGRALGLTVFGVALACAALALLALYGLPVADRLVPALPHGREIAVLGLLGLAGAALYGILLLGFLHGVGVRLRRR
jgi:putative peptidoglycan lipid II flippase